MHKKFEPRNTVLLLIIAVIAAIRIFNNTGLAASGLANYSPLAAITLFAGAYFKGNARVLLVPLLTIFISDVILYATVYKDHGNGLLYDGWLWVYGAFLLMALAGKFILRRLTLHRMAAAIVAAVFIHWIVTDLGVWAGSSTYPQTLAGFYACLAAAIPFELRLLTATVVYSAVMFGVFGFVQQRYPILQADFD